MQYRQCTLQQIAEWHIAKLYVRKQHPVLVLWYCHEKAGKQHAHDNEAGIGYNKLTGEHEQHAYMHKE